MVVAAGGLLGFDPVRAWSSGPLVDLYVIVKHGDEPKCPAPLRGRR